MKKLMAALCFVLSIWSAAHNGAVNAMTEWGTITQTHAYSPNWELWLTSAIAIISMWAGISLLWPMRFAT